ncbi:MAG: hypothetical protein P8X62_09005 [Flavobacteriaceae bacterium]
MEFSKTLFALLLVFLCLSCKEKSVQDISALEQEILQVHDLSRKYHVEKMAEAFISQLSDEHISVNKGKISHLNREEKIKQVKQYFDLVEFEKWDDIEPPIIRFSDDYSMAYTIVNKELVLNYMNEENKKVREKTIFSWVAIYTKHDGTWKVDCIASTNQPSISEIIN